MGKPKDSPAGGALRKLPWQLVSGRRALQQRAPADHDRRADGVRQHDPVLIDDRVLLRRGAERQPLRRAAVCCGGDPSSCTLHASKPQMRPITTACTSSAVHVKYTSRHDYKLRFGMHCTSRASTHSGVHASFYRARHDVAGSHPAAWPSAAAARAGAVSAAPLHTPAWCRPWRTPAAATAPTVRSRAGAAPARAPPQRGPSLPPSAGSAR